MKEFEDQSFDIILCHNVFEYALERETVTKEFARLLKKGGVLSVIKHNRPGRIIQMVVLLNNFEHANELLDGSNGKTENFGDIHYYDDMDIIKWSNDFQIEKILGMRTFWDLQQNQEIQKDEKWQKQKEEELEGAYLMTYEEAMNIFQFESSKRILNEAKEFIHL